MRERCPDCDVAAFERPQVFSATEGLWPTCAVCKRPVERMDSYYDARRCCTVIIARCHGQREEVELEDELLADLACRRITVLEAFRNPLLPP